MKGVRTFVVGAPGAPMFGAIPVPWTVSWSAEEGFFLARCAYAEAIAIHQGVGQGQGKPQFGKPHMQRQREAIARGLCDLCGKPLAARTKVSLSHARVRPHGAEGPAVLQVEPLLHRECARESASHCPSLKRDIASGALCVRQVYRWRVQFAVMTAEYVETLTGDARKAIGHAKVELLSWADRDEDWLAGGAV